MIFVDTTSVVPADGDHTAATRWLSANRQPLIATDYVVDETLTLLRVRGENRRALTLGEALFSGSLAAIHYLTEEEISEAWGLFRGYADKEWSFTDCTSKVVMARLNVAYAFAFDQRFRQFGTVTVVP